ncbi:hypothetical protein C8A05DRAFT_45688 [Staphylotrichum tortipilum]|uniref:Uncharacterized protein n=1 Tax=Staphylotrichum tortipilum TaxID=2831512 RepID=A0AAN6RS50_9PEZI|nr:hypothetical protein C8A05DRAFT_45688 [Staphylotrichum longicolle]
MEGCAETKAPAWGALPVEQYLIRNWNSSAELSADEQRTELVSSFIHEDVLDPELFRSPPSRIPTAAEVADILEPWRPERLRRIAAAFLEHRHKHDYYILRTYCGGGAADDAKLRGWLDTLFEERDDVGIWPENEWLYVLDDPTLFDFADDYTGVYSILPELAGNEMDRRFMDEDVEKARKAGRVQIRDEPHIPEEEHWEDAITWVAAVRMPFEEQELGLSLRDTKGVPVKECTIYLDVESLEGLKIDCARGKLWETGWYEIPAAGEYKTRGKIIRRLMARVKGE